MTLSPTDYKIATECIIISRVSDAKQKDGFSLDAQEKFGREYAQKRGWKIIKNFSFQESASKQLQRKKFNEVKTYIETYPKNKTLIVIAEKSDRLARNDVDKDFLQNRYVSGRIEVHLYRENKIFDHNSTATDLFIDDIMSAVNKYASNNISRESLKGMVEKCEQGLFPGRAPLGYINVIDEVGRFGKVGQKIIVPDPKSRLIPLKVFELKDQGLSLEAIRLKMLESGLIPDKFKGHFARASSIDKILKRMFYGGSFIWRLKTYKGCHELIIPPDLYNRVMRKFNQPSKRINQKMGTFTGWLRCQCGCRITYDPKRTYNKAGELIRQHEYYTCANGKKLHEKNVYISEDKIFEQLATAIDAISIPESKIAAFASDLNAGNKTTMTATKREIEGLEATLTALEMKENALYDDKFTGNIDVETYKRLMEKLSTERNSLKDKIQKLNQSLDDKFLITAENIFELCKSAKTLWNGRSSEEKKHLLDLLLSNHEIDGLSVRFKLKKPFQILSEMAFSPLWRPQFFTIRTYQRNLCIPKSKLSSLTTGL